MHKESSSIVMGKLLTPVTRSRAIKNGFRNIADSSTGPPRIIPTSPLMSSLKELEGELKRHQLNAVSVFPDVSKEL
jgi:hypothetical protein